MTQIEMILEKLSAMDDRLRALEGNDTKTGIGFECLFEASPYEELDRNHASDMISDFITVLKPYIPMDKVYDIAKELAHREACIFLSVSNASQEVESWQNIVNILER